MRRTAGAAAAGALASGILVAVAASSTPSSASYLYDLETIKGEFSAGTWQTTPTICDEVLDRPHATVVTGSEGPDILIGFLTPNGNHPQVILGLGGKDLLKGGNQHDCLVGGEGNDLIGAVSDDANDKKGKENGKDILLGGPGDDLLVSGNGKDHLDGGEGFDICLGQNGKDTILNCERILSPRWNKHGLDLQELNRELDAFQAGDVERKSEIAMSAPGDAPAGSEPAAVEGADAEERPLPQVAPEERVRETSEPSEPTAKDVSESPSRPGEDAADPQSEAQPLTETAPVRESDPLAEPDPAATPTQ